MDQLLERMIDGPSTDDWVAEPVTPQCAPIPMLIKTRDKTASLESWW